MATYIKGVTDYVPQVQPWSPDYNFYQNVLERKQQQYNRGWEQTNSLYNSILNAPMMRSQNIERRDKFFKDIEGQIQQLSGVDLSLAQNVDAASQIFKPFYEDQNIVHDIGYTNKYREQMQHADYLKNCTDKDKCGGKYWSGGVRLMQYKAQDFVNATDEEALRMSAPSYTNYVNFMEKAQAAVKDAGFKMVTDKISGGYKVTTQNGKQVIGPLQDFMMARFGDDPELLDFYNAKAALMGYEQPDKAVSIYEQAVLRGKAKDQAEYDAMIKERSERIKFNAAKETINKKAEDEKSGLAGMLERKAILEGVIEQKGALPNSDILKEHQELTTNIPIKEASVNQVEKAATMVNGLSYIDEEGNKVPNHVINSIVGQALMMNDIGSAARTLAFKDFQQTRQADPFALKSYDHKLQLERQVRKAANEDAQATLKYIRDRAADGDREFISRAKFLNDLIIDQGKTLNQAFNIYRQEYQAGNITGYDLYDKSMAGTISSTTSTTDTRLAKAIDAAKVSNVDAGRNLQRVANNAIGGIQQDIAMNKQNYEAHIGGLMDSKLNKVINTAVDPKLSDNTLASYTVVGFGDRIKAMEANNDPIVKAFKEQMLPEGVSVWDKYFADFPHKNNRSVENSEGLFNLKNDAATPYLTKLLGSEFLYNLIQSDVAPMQVMDPKNPALIDTESLGVISTEEFNQLVKNPDTTPEQNQQIMDYLNKTDSVKTIAGTNYFRYMLSPEDADMITSIDWYKKNADNMESSFKNQVEGTVVQFGNATNLEGTDAVGAFVRKNPWDKNANYKQGGVSSTAALMKKAVTDDKLWKDYQEEHRIKFAFKGGWGISPSILEMEKDYSTEGDELKFQDESLKGVLQKSLPSKVNINQLDWQSLYKANNVSTEPEAMGFLQEDRIPTDRAWEVLMRDPNTKVVRTPNDHVKIESPYLKAPMIKNLDDIKVHAQVEDIFNDIEDKYAPVVAEFMDALQNTGNNPDNTAYGVTDFSIPTSDFNMSLRSVENIRLVPNKPIKAYDGFVDLFKEIEQNYNNVDLSEYGINAIQGDPVQLNNVIRALSDTYPKGKNMPEVIASYAPVAGTDLTKVTVKFDPATVYNYAKSQGMDVTGIPIKDAEDERIGTMKGVQSGLMQTSTYYIANSKSPIIAKSKPSAYSNRLKNLKNGESLIDSSQAANTDGAYTEYIRKGGQVEMIYHLPFYNADTGKTGFSTKPIGSAPLLGPDDEAGWESIIKENNRKLHLYIQMLYQEYDAQGILKHETE